MILLVYGRITRVQKGDDGDAATVTAGTTTTLAAGQSAKVTNTGSTSAAVFKFEIPKGDMEILDLQLVKLEYKDHKENKEQGEAGPSIISGDFVGDDLVFTKTDESTVTIEDAKTTTSW